MLLGGRFVPNASGQLAITEVMSETATNGTFKGPDFWELTHFGTTNIALDGYAFSDNRTDRLFRGLFEGRVIHPGESLIFFRWQEDRSVTTPEEFRAWWGDSRLPADLQIGTYPSPGFDGDLGDEVWLYDPLGRVVDHVKFGIARGARSFSYDPESGVFGVFSAPGVGGAFRAELADDIGSPGLVSGPSPLRILQPVASQSVDAGMAATFSVLALGMPPPGFQWFAKGVAVPGAVESGFTLPVVKVADAGEYRVRIENGLTVLTSAVATLTVTTSPRPPLVVSGPSNITVLPGQAASFSVFARGYPAPHCQWQADGVDLPGQTNTTLTVPEATLEMSGLQFGVRVWNTLGSTNLSARLYVTPRPCLRFTEVMPWTASESRTPHHDWFELTNCGTNAVDLRGYRFSDKQVWVDALTITNRLVIQPRESIIFASQMPDWYFKGWWGEQNLPPGLQIYTYVGFNLNKYGESLFLWNPTANDTEDYVASVSWASTTCGVSLECVNDCVTCPETGCVGECLLDSVLGQGGAFASADPGDIGSPGYAGDPPPRVRSICQQESGYWIECRVTVGRVYRLSWTPTLEYPVWTGLETFYAEDETLWLNDSQAGSDPARFYRVEELPLADSPPR